jgi:hypothetical protein
VEAGSIFDITGNGGITVGSGGSANIVNAALFEKTSGTGTSIVGPAMSSTGTVAVAIGTLDFIGASNSFAGTIRGAGGIEFGGGANTIASGAVMNIATISIEGTGTTVTLGENIAGRVRLIEGSATTLALGAHTLGLSGAATLAGTIAGTGTLELDGGVTTLLSGFTLSTAAALLSGGTLALGANQADAGSFTESAGDISLQGHNLTLTGADNFTGGTVTGAGYLSTRSIKLSALALGGGAVWTALGTTTESGNLTLGSSGGGTGRLVVEASAVFDITGNAGIAIGSGGSASIANVALFEKTGGTGLSTVSPAFSNTGTILASVGTLDLAGVVSGAGRATIGATGTLEFAGAVASGQTIAFAGTTGGDLILNDPSGNGLGFAGSVTGFGGKDQLDLATFAFSGNPAIGWSQTSSSSGTLTVTDGSKVAKITLFGQYAQAGFGKAKDGGNGTTITYTPPAQVALLAAPHH